MSFNSDKKDWDGNDEDAPDFTSGGAGKLSAPNSTLPEHIEETVRATVRLHTDHQRTATPG